MRRWISWGVALLVLPLPAVAGHLSFTPSTETVEIVPGQSFSHEVSAPAGLRSEDRPSFRWSGLPTWMSCTEPTSVAATCAGTVPAAPRSRTLKLDVSLSNDAVHTHAYYTLRLEVRSGPLRYTSSSSSSSFSCDAGRAVAWPLPAPRGGVGLRSYSYSGLPSWASGHTFGRLITGTCVQGSGAIAVTVTDQTTPAAQTATHTVMWTGYPQRDAGSAVEDGVLNVGFYAYFRPISYSADEDEDNEGFNTHRGYEADLLTALEALDGVGFSFARQGIPGWAEPGVVPIWRRSAEPEYDIVGGGITILDSRTRDAAGKTIVAFTNGHVAFRQSLLVRREDAERLARYADLTSDVRVGVLAGTTGEARLLQIVGLADDEGVLAAGTRVETPRGTVRADGSGKFRITSAQVTANLEGRLRLHPPVRTKPTVIYLGYEDGESELLDALRSGRIAAVARGEIGNRDAAKEERGRFVVTAVDVQAEYGGFTVDVRDTALLARLNDAISWLTNGRRIGFAEWNENDQVFMRRTALWNSLNGELTLEAGDVWTRSLNQLFPAGANEVLQFTARSDDPSLAVATIADGTLTITPDAYAEGTVRITVTATDAFGNRATLRLVATLVPTPHRLLRGWRLPWLAGEMPAAVTPAPSGWMPGVFEDAASFRALCLEPRGNTQDARGTMLDENNWLRSWSNDTYLWYDEIVDRDPACCDTPDYFGLLKTTATTPSGRPRDRFHFTYDTDDWIALSQSGVSGGYGAELVILRGSPPRDIRVAYTEPNSPATSAAVALVRGTRILEIDGVDVRSGSDVDTLNAGLRPEVGETHEFMVQDPGAEEARSVTMRAAAITIDPVQHVRVLRTAGGPVGYMLFNDHIATAEAQLIDAVASFASARITDLVLDLRYNGGGRLSIANRLAAMIAGRAARGRTFEDLQFNDKHRVFNPVTGQRLRPYLFESTASDGEPLPTLDLERLFVLAGPGTCSASESIVNGLRGIDVDVVLIGATTCGKPYGFYATDNCGTTYFTIQIKGVNAKGFGDFTDGFSPANALGPKGTDVPGCAVFDDYDHPLGDADEARLKAALQYRAEGSCPEPSRQAPDAEPVAEIPGLDPGGQALDQRRPPGFKVLDW